MKKYYMWKGRRYGVENTIETRLGRFPIMMMGNIRWALSSMGIVALGRYGSWIIKKNHITSEMFLTIWTLCSLFAMAYIVFGFFFELWNQMFVGCRYASDDREEIENHYRKRCEKETGYEEYTTDIWCIDDRYYYFAKKRGKK